MDWQSVDSDLNLIYWSAGNWWLSNKHIKEFVPRNAHQEVNRRLWLVFLGLLLDSLSLSLFLRATHLSCWLLLSMSAIFQRPHKRGAKNEGTSKIAVKSTRATSQIQIQQHARSQIQIHCNGCPASSYSFRALFFFLFSLLLLDKGQHAKCKASIRYVLARLSTLGHKRKWGARKNYGSSAGYGRDFKSHYCLCLRQGTGASWGLRAPFDLWHICYKVNTKRSHTASIAF